VQMDIRDGHQVTIDTVLAWCDESPGMLKVTRRARRGTLPRGARNNSLLETMRQHGLKARRRRPAFCYRLCGGGVCARVCTRLGGEQRARSLLGQDGVRPGVRRGVPGHTARAAGRRGRGERHFERHGDGSGAARSRARHLHGHLRGLGPRVGALDGSKPPGCKAAFFCTVC